jgi:hypothetical protein
VSGFNSITLCELNFSFIVMCVHDLPTCRGLSFNSLSGTLPKEWSAMTSLSDV